MKATLAAILVLSVGLAASAQSHDLSAIATLASSTGGSAAPAHVELHRMLADADNIVSSTNTDLANLHVEKWASGWKTAWMKKSSHKHQAGQTADSVKQLASGLTPVIADVRTTHGGVGSSFKLYNSLTLVCENMESLVEATHSYGKKEDYTKISADYSNLLRLRNDLATFVEQRATVIDPHGSIPAAPMNASASKKDEAHSASAKKLYAKRKKPVLRANN
jgi:hypothetical protein